MAKILELALGPVPKMLEDLDFFLYTQEYGTTHENAINFLSGLLDKFAIDNNLAELAVCADDAEGELLLADKIVDELNAGQKAKASGDIARFTANLP